MNGFEPLSDLPFTLDAITVVLIAATAGLLSTFALFSLFDRDRAKRAARLRRIQAGPSHGVSGSDPVSASLRRDRGDGVSAFRFARLVPRRDLLARRLARAGLSVSIGLYGSACLICMALFAGLLQVWGAVSPPVALLGGIALGLFLPHLTVGFLISRREAAFLKNLPEGIDVMVRGLKAGLPVTETLAAAGRESAEPVGAVLCGASNLVKMGRPVEDAVATTAENMAVPELRFLAITLSVQKETGGNLTETLSNLSEILRKRRQMKLKVRAVSSEARASSLILGSLPFVMFAIIFLVNRSYVMQLFEDPRGHVLIGMGLGSIAAGVFVMSRMIRFDI